MCDKCNLNNIIGIEQEDLILARTTCGNDMSYSYSEKKILPTFKDIEKQILRQLNIFNGLLHNPSRPKYL